MVTRWLPTLLHPKLPEIAKNVARFVQEETIALIVDSLQSEWFAATNKETKPWTPQDVGVTVPPSRRLRPLPPPPGPSGPGTSASCHSGTPARTAATPAPGGAPRTEPGGGRGREHPMTGAFPHIN